MIGINFPTSKDVYIEVDGKRLAAVDGYKIKSTCDKRYIRSFWEIEPIGILSGNIVHEIELSRIYLYNNEFDNYKDFFNLSNFDVVFIKPDKRVIYHDCKWIKISENINSQNMIIEDAILVSTNRCILDN